jgi:BlaI family transcriptional regulator, penicillinase repressor
VTNPYGSLGARERQIMDIVHRRGRATAEDVRADLSTPVTNSTVRTMLRLLEGKGYLRHEQDGVRYVYMLAADPDQVRRRVVRDLVSTFFRSSASSAVVTLLGEYEERLTDEDLERLDALIHEIRLRARVGDEEER